MQENVDENVQVEATPRKSTRNRKPNKFEEYLVFNTPKQRTRYSYIDDEASSADDEPTQKPTALFFPGDVEGQDMFEFKSRHTKNDLQNKVKSALKASHLDSSMKTPRTSFLVKSEASTLNVSLATPKSVKDIMKKRISRGEVENESAQSDFSGSSSDYVPDESEGEYESALSSSETEEEAKKPEKKKDLKRPKDSEYVVTPDNYFMMNSSKKITTSDHTLERQKNFHFNEDEQKKEIELSKEHQTKIEELVKSYDELFKRWLFILSEGFNLMLYGAGSKRGVINKFVDHNLKMAGHPLVIVNGFFPSLTIKCVLEYILLDFLDCSRVPSNLGDVLKLIDSRLNACEIDLFLIVHNIDGQSLRDAKSQAILAGLSQIRNVHTIATIDHINAPLLWDHTRLSKFNFSWWDVTTMLPYSEETSYENSLLPHRCASLQLSSLKSVFQSLTSNAKGIFNIIVKHHMENHKQPSYQGISFRELYALARESFLASSDAALRAQLTEFLDHKLIRSKRGPDAGEQLVLTIDHSLLVQFMETQQT